MATGTNFGGEGGDSSHEKYHGKEFENRGKEFENRGKEGTYGSQVSCRPRQRLWSCSNTGLITIHAQILSIVP